MRHRALIPALVLALGCAVTIPGTGGPATSGYDFDSLVSDLRFAGASLEVTDDVWDSNVFDDEVQAQAINIDGARATVLTYVNAAAESEALRISPDGSAIAGTYPGVAQFVEWADIPHVFKKGKLILYCIGNDKHVLEILEYVLGPQFAGG